MLAHERLRTAALASLDGRDDAAVLVLGDGEDRRPSGELRLHRHEGAGRGEGQRVGALDLPRQGLAAATRPTSRSWNWALSST